MKDAIIAVALVIAITVALLGFAAGVVALERWKRTPFTSEDEHDCVCQ